MIAVKTTVLFKVSSADIKDIISVNNPALFVYGYTSVSIAVKSKSAVKLLFAYQLLKLLYMGGTAVEIDIESVGLATDNICPGTQSIEN